MSNPSDSPNSFSIGNWDPEDSSRIPDKSNDSDCENRSNVSDLGWTSQSLSSDDSLIEDDDFFMVQDSALAKLNLQLTESDRRLIDEFCKKMEGVKKKYNQKSALRLIQHITNKYLKKGIRLNSCYGDCDKTVTNFIFEEIVGVLDSVVYINSSTAAPERSNSSNNESQDCDDTDKISSKSLKIIKKIASNLLLKGGKVRRDLFYHGRIGYATTAFVGNNNSLQFNEYIVAQCKEIENDLKNVAYESIVNKNKQTQKDELEVEIDNGYFYIEYPQDSIIEVIKILNNEKAQDLNLRVGILKIGESTVRVESIGEKKNYTDLADNSDIALTFNTSEGELEVRLYPDMRNKDLIRVEVRSAEAIKNCNEEIGKNCLLGSLSVNEAIEQGYFKKPGKLCQSSETTSPSNKIVEEEKLQRGNNYWQDKEVQRSMEKEEGGKRR